jgi:hypothetical protein
MRSAGSIQVCIRPRRTGGLAARLAARPLRPEPGTDDGLVDLRARDLSRRIPLWSGLSLVGGKQIDKQPSRRSPSRPVHYDSQAGRWDEFPPRLRPIGGVRGGLAGSHRLATNVAADPARHRSRFGCSASPTTPALSRAAGQRVEQHSLPG